MRAVDLTCEGTQSPLGLTLERPHLGWRVESEVRGARQTAWQIEVYASPTAIGEKTAPCYWDSGKVYSSSSRFHPYGGYPLSSFQRLWWRVRLWDEEDSAGQWSELAWWETGPLQANDWCGSWLTHLVPPDPGEAGPPAVCLRKEFAVERNLVKAVLYSTARGVCQNRLNGAETNDDVLHPGFFDYRRRQYFRACEVGHLLVAGVNCWSVLLGDGWYSGALGFQCHRSHFGRYPLYLGMLRLTYEDGRVDWVVTDSSWQAGTSEWRSTDLFQGSSQDLTHLIPGWEQPGASIPSNWTTARAERLDGIPLQWDPAPPLRITEQIPGLQRHTAGASLIIDFGKILAGWVSLELDVPRPYAISIRHGEWLNPDGTLYTANLRYAKQEDRFRGPAGKHQLEPLFTYHGFRYISIEGLPEGTRVLNVTARAIHTDMRLVGEFSCSDAMVEQVWRNIVQSQRGTFLCIPADCQQRDERLGWTGDALNFARTAACNMDVELLYDRYVQALVDGQTLEGGFPEVGPRISTWLDGAPAWGDAGVLLPWFLYEFYGNEPALRKYFPAMEGWMSYIQRANPDLLRKHRCHGNYGDWVAQDKTTDKVLLATAFWARCARAMTRAAAVLGLPEKEAHYRELEKGIRSAATEEFVREDGVVATGSQGSQVLALCWLLEEGLVRERAMTHLVRDIRDRGMALSTGFLGTGQICVLLSENGHHEVACALVQREEFPSWKHMVRQGATTVWERWDTYTLEHGLQDPEMNSFNHVALGAVGEWYFRCLAGIAQVPNGVGWQIIQFQPKPGGSFTRASAVWQSPHGAISSSWETGEGTFAYEGRIPPNCVGRLVLPEAMAGNLQEQVLHDQLSGKPLEPVSGVRKKAWRLPSGPFRITCSTA